MASPTAKIQYEGMLEMNESQMCAVLDQRLGISILQPFMLIENLKTAYKEHVRVIKVAVPWHPRQKLLNIPFLPCRRRKISRTQLEWGAQGAVAKSQTHTSRTRRRQNLGRDRRRCSKRNSRLLQDRWCAFSSCSGFKRLSEASTTFPRRHHAQLTGHLCLCFLLCGQHRGTLICFPGDLLEAAQQQCEWGEVSFVFCGQDGGSAVHWHCCAFSTG